jgi:NADH-quinone oxidoreductase subunit L
MTTPLIVLSVLAAIGGVLNIPVLFGGENWLSGFLAPVFADAMAVKVQPAALSHATEWLLMATTLAGCLVTIFWAWRRYVKQENGLLPDEAKRSLLVQLISKKYYIDELYDFVFVKPSLWCSRYLHQVVELRFIDRIVNGVGQVVIWTGNTVRYVQTGNVGFYMFIMILGIILILFFNILI